MRKKVVFPMGIIILAIIYVCSVFLKSKKRKALKKQEIIKFIFVAYILVIVSFILLPILIPPPINSQTVEYNFDVSYLLQAFSDRAALLNIAGNVLFFVPFSILGKTANIKIFKNLSVIVIISLMVSVAIEVLQGLETHFGFVDPAGINVSDINNVITNVLGGVLGWVLIYFYQKDKVSSN